MDDLIAFLRARLDEDEQAIRSRDEYAPIHYVGCYYFIHTIDRDYCCDCHEGYDPSPPQLADVASKRGIVSWCTEVIGDRDLSRYSEFGSLKSDREALAVTLSVETLRLLTQPYAEHSDYSPDWMPRWTT